MKRIALGALVVLLLSHAVLAEETRRYMVATRRPAREVAGQAMRRVRAFEIVKAFAADLTPSEAAALKASPDVRWIEPVVQRHLLASVSKPGEQMTPYGITQIHAVEAWAGRRSVSVNVAVIDSGIDRSHPEFRGAWGGSYNTIDPSDPEAMDEIGHGTHVAGTIAANNNHFGVVGVAPGVKLWSVKAFDANGNGSMEDVLNGLEWIVNKKKEIGGRWVVNMSFGGTDPSDSEREAFQAAKDAGLIMVAAAGNESSSNIPVPVDYPAAYPSILAVGAVDDRQLHASFSNQGPEVALVAPGVKVISTEPAGYAFVSYVRSDDAIYNSRPLEGSKSGGVKGEFVYCGLGTPAEFPANMHGKIALIQRGGDTFADKARHAKEAGATGVVIYNNNTSGINWTLYPAEDPDAKNYDWPVVVAMSQADGEVLAAKGSGKMQIGYDSDDYDDRTGTSMSAPHVTGAIALLWSMAPDATPGSIINALVTTATDLGAPGKDDVFGNGEINVFAAAKFLAPEAFVDSTSGPSTGRRYLSRRH